MNGIKITELVANQGKEPKEANSQNTGGLRRTGQGKLMQDITEGQRPAPGRRVRPDEALDRLGQAQANRTKY